MLIARYGWYPDSLSTIPAEPTEQVLAHSLKAQARIKLNSAKIKLHRYRAFLDIPIFSQRYCDVAPAAKRTASNVSACSCTGLLSQASSPTSDLVRDLSSPSSSVSPTPLVDRCIDSPFSSRFSAKACMKAALAIARAFESLPYPNPTLTSESSQPGFLSKTSITPAPRTMPTFVCCAMQSSYALLMLCHRTSGLNHNRASSHAVTSGLEELHSGLQRVLGALQNYSIAFEALYGMRGM